MFAQYTHVMNEKTYMVAAYVDGVQWSEESQTLQVGQAIFQQVTRLLVKDMFDHTIIDFSKSPPLNALLLQFS